MICHSPLTRAYFNVYIVYYNASCATYNKSSAAEMGDRDHMSRKDGLCAPIAGAGTPV